MSAAYPTAEQILAQPVRFRAGVADTVKAWQADHRGQLRTARAVTDLLERLATLYGKPVRVEFRADTRDHYRPATQTIVLNGRHISIVTALHEFAHHLYGPSELTACRWSVWLYAATFPKSFTRGHFRGHLFVAGGAQ